MRVCERDREAERQSRERERARSKNGNTKRKIAGGEVLSRSQDAHSKIRLRQQIICTQLRANEFKRSPTQKSPHIRTTTNTKNDFFFRKIFSCARTMSSKFWHQHKNLQTPEYPRIQKSCFAPHKKSSPHHQLKVLHHIALERRPRAQPIVRTVRFQHGVADDDEIAVLFGARQPDQVATHDCGVKGREGEGGRREGGREKGEKGGGDGGRVGGWRVCGV